MSASNVVVSRRERVPRPSRDEVRQRLLDAAAEVLVSHGFGAASVDTITAAAGLSRGALYSNFADKEELYLTLLAQMEAAQVAELSALYDEESGVETFLARIAARTPRAEDDPRNVLILQTELWLLGTRDERVRKRLASIQRRTVDAIASVIGSPALGLTPHEIGVVVLAVCDGLTAQRVTDPSAVRSSLLFDALKAIALVGGVDVKEPE